MQQNNALNSLNDNFLKSQESVHDPLVAIHLDIISSNNSYNIKEEIKKDESVDDPLVTVHTIDIEEFKIEPGSDNINDDSYEYKSYQDNVNKGNNLLENEENVVGQENLNYEVLEHLKIQHSSLNNNRLCL